MKHQNRQEQSLEIALHGIDVLKDISLVIVPLRPSAEMLEIGSRAARISPAQARLAYESMIRAALPGDLGGGLI